MSRTIIKFKNDNYEDIRIDNRSIQRDIIVASLTSAYTLTSINTYEQIPLTELYCVGDKLKTNSDGNIVIGAGVSMVKVNASVTILSPVTAGAKHVRIVANDTMQVQATQYCTTSGDSVISVPDSIFKVEEGDVIELVVYSNSLDTISGSTSLIRTRLTVEVIE